MPSPRNTNLLFKVSYSPNKKTTLHHLENVTGYNSLRNCATILIECNEEFDGEYGLLVRGDDYRRITSFA